MFLGVLFGLCLASVPLCGGRIGALAEVRLRGTAIIATALATQVVIISVLPGGTPTLHRTVHLATYGLAGVFAWLNRRVPGVAVASVGALANFLAIAANGGVMPASSDALRVAGLATETGGFENSTAVAGAHLQWLGDIFAIPASVPVHNVFSVGDVLLVLGAFIGLHVVCGTWPARRLGIHPVTVSRVEVRPTGTSRALVRVVTVPHRGMEPGDLLVDGERLEPLPGSTRAAGYAVPVAALAGPMALVLPNSVQMNIAGHLSRPLVSRPDLPEAGGAVIVLTGDPVQGGTR